MNIAQYLSTGLNLSYNQIEAISKLADACGMTTLFESAESLDDWMNDWDEDEEAGSSDSEQVSNFVNTLKSNQQAAIAAEQAKKDAELAREEAERAETRKVLNTPIGKSIPKDTQREMAKGGQESDSTNQSDIFSLIDLHEKTGRSAGVDMDFGNQSDSEFSGDSENLNDVEKDTVQEVKNASTFDQDVNTANETNDVNTQEQDALQHIVTKLGDFSTKTKEAVQTIADNVVSTLAQSADENVDVDTVGERDSLYYKSSGDDARFEKQLRDNNLANLSEEEREKAMGSGNTVASQAGSADARQDLEDLVADVNRKLSTVDVDDDTTRSHLNDLYNEIYTFTTRYMSNQFNDALQSITGYDAYKDTLEGKAKEMSDEAPKTISAPARTGSSFRSHAVNQKLDFAKRNRSRKASGKRPWTWEEYKANVLGEQPDDLEFWKAMNADKVM